MFSPLGGGSPSLPGPISHPTPDPSHASPCLPANLSHIHHTTRRRANHIGRPGVYDRARQAGRGEAGEGGLPRTPAPTPCPHSLHGLSSFQPSCPLPFRPRAAPPTDSTRHIGLARLCALGRGWGHHCTSPHSFTPPRGHCGPFSPKWCEA